MASRPLGGEIAVVHGGRLSHVPGKIKPFDMEIEIRRRLAQALGVNQWRLFTLLLAVAICAGCKQATTPAAEPVEGMRLPTAAQPRLQTMKLWVGPEEMRAELALNSEQQIAGMMFRTNLAENAGMLFVFPIPHRASFWMKNCPLPLSAAYIDSDGAILEVHDLQPHNTNSVVAASERVQYVLETNQGWFERHHVTPGMVIRTEQGTLKETFFRER